MQIEKNPSYSVRFNRQGTVLLCKEVKQSPVVYNVITGQQVGGGANSRVQFSSPGYAYPNSGRRTLCFAGQDDELVVSASADHGLYVWSLPTDQPEDGEVSEQIVDSSLTILRGHNGYINAVRYNHQSGTLASAGAEKIIKLWTPIVRQ